MAFFGEAVAQLRKELGLSQRELARRIQVAPSYLNQIENGQKGAPPYPLVQKIAEELDVSVESFFDEAAKERGDFPPDTASIVENRPETLGLLRSIQRRGLQASEILTLRKQVEQGSGKAVILAAGRGTRMKSLTRDLPKCLAIKLNGKTLLKSQIDTLHKAGLTDLVVVKGYQGDKIRYPGIRFAANPDYENTNILESLMCAAPELEGEVIVSYSDIWYEEEIVTKLLRSPKDIVLGVDIDWEKSYRGRKDHPAEEAELAVFDSENRVLQIGKIAGSRTPETHGEFIGLVKLSARGCNFLKEHYHRAKKLYASGPFQRAKSLKQAYLTDLFQEMVDLGVPIHCEIIRGRWREIDTLEDLRRVRQYLERSKNS